MASNGLGGVTAHGSAPWIPEQELLIPDTHQGHIKHSYVDTRKDQQSFLSQIRHGRTNPLATCT